MKDVTILIKTFLRDDVVKAYVESIRKYYPDIAIVVADDGHITDEKREWFESMDCEYHTMPWDSGLCAGRNFLVDRIKTKYFLIGDDDFYFTQDTDLSKMVDMMDIYDIVGGAVRTKGSIGHYEGFIHHGDREITYTKLEQSDWLEYGGIRHKPCELVYNFAMFDREALGDVRWDNNIKIVYEHSDFFMAAKAAGLDVGYVPDVIVDHKHVDIENNDEYASYRLRYSDRKYFFEKHGVDKVTDMHGNIMTL